MPHLVPSLLPLELVLPRFPVGSCALTSMRAILGRRQLVSACLFWYIAHLVCFLDSFDPFGACYSDSGPIGPPGPLGGPIPPLLAEITSSILSIIDATSLADLIICSFTTRGS